METHQFWAFFVIALIAGGAITLAVSNATMTGYAVQAQPTFLSRFFRPVQPTPTCTDSDGGANFFVRGTVVDRNGYIKSDFCLDSDTLYEYECIENGDFNGIEFTCEHGCDYGACITKRDCSNCEYVLNMFSVGCSTITIPNACTGVTFTCNDVCNKIGKTCTQGLAYYKAYPGIPEFNESRYRLMECKSDIDCMEPIYGELSCMCCSASNLI